MALELEAARGRARRGGQMANPNSTPTLTLILPLPYPNPNQEARQQERAQEAEGLVGRYQQHIMRLQAAQAAREEEVRHPRAAGLPPSAW